MQRELLERPFAPNQIKQRKGNFGKTLDYVEGHEVIKRLNDAFEVNWSFQVISHEIFDNEVMVLGELTADGIKKMQFGSCVITKARDTGQVLSIAENLKAATTDSLKKCATMFGIGLHLYGDAQQPPTGYALPKKQSDSSNNSGTNNMSTNRSHTNHTITNPSPSKSTNPSSTKQTARISNKQFSYLISLGNSLGMSKQDLDKRAIGKFGASVSFLSVNDASSLIQQLSQ